MNSMEPLPSFNNEQLQANLISSTHSLILHLSYVEANPDIVFYHL